MNERVPADRITDRARRVLDSAASIAAVRGASLVEPDHILIALVCESGGVAGYVLRQLGLSAAAVEAMLPAAGTASANLGALPLSDESQRAVAAAGDVAAQLWHNYIGTEHLVIGVSGTPSVQAILAAMGVTPMTVRQNVLEILGH